MELAQSSVDARPGVVLDYIIVNAPLLNMNFSALSSSKVGFAAVGQSTNDYWNGYTVIPQDLKAKAGDFCLHLPHGRDESTQKGSSPFQVQHLAPDLQFYSPA
jgi:hypothetical protein